MIKLSQSLAALDSNKFASIFKQEIKSIDHDLLPLQAGLSYSSYVSDDDVSAIILNRSTLANQLQIKAGLFYSGIIAGCSCSDDPTPTDVQNEYCEVLFNINTDTATTTVELLTE